MMKKSMWTNGIIAEPDALRRLWLWRNRLLKQDCGFHTAHWACKQCLEAREGEAMIQNVNAISNLLWRLI